MQAIQLNCILISALKFEVKVKGHPRAGRDGPEGENRSSSAPFLTLCVRWLLGGTRHTSATLPTVESQYSFFMRLKI